MFLLFHPHPSSTGLSELPHLLGIRSFRGPETWKLLLRSYPGWLIWALGQSKVHVPHANSLSFWVQNKWECIHHSYGGDLPKCLYVSAPFCTHAHAHTHTHTHTHTQKPGSDFKWNKKSSHLWEELSISETEAWFRISHQPFVFLLPETLNL